MNGATTTYYYAGDTLTAQKTGTQTMRFILNAAGEALGFTYGGITYYYAKNLQGDVTALTNNEGDVLARYAYDAWGRPISVTATNGNATYLAAANANPYRYRGYYYDAESGWYFLTTRYYVPEWGRFLTEDVFPGMNGDLQSLNMFAYCSFNPVNFADTNGLQMVHLEHLCGGYSGEKAADSQRSGQGNNLTTKEMISNDLRKFSLFNTDEDKVLEAYYFSSYRGVPVVKTNMERSGSFGVLFISRKEHRDDDGMNAVRHEYGHVIQLVSVGIPNYLFYYFLPSACFTEIFKSMDPYYYDLPWDITADLFGGVNCRDHKTGDIVVGLLYYCFFSIL